LGGFNGERELQTVLFIPFLPFSFFSFLELKKKRSNGEKKNGEGFYHESNGEEWRSGVMEGGKMRRRS